MYILLLRCLDPAMHPVVIFRPPTTIEYTDAQVCIVYPNGRETCHMMHKTKHTQRNLYKRIMHHPFPYYTILVSYAIRPLWIREHCRQLRTAPPAHKTLKRKRFIFETPRVRFFGPFRRWWIGDKSLFSCIPPYQCMQQVYAVQPRGRTKLFAFILKRI